MNRRGFLKATGGALGAATAALTLKRGIGLPEAQQGVEGQQVSVTNAYGVAPMGGTLITHGHSISVGSTFVGANWPADTQWAEVTGPDPGTYVYTEFGTDGRIAVIPPGADSPWSNEMVRGIAIPVAEFPEFDPAHGVVFLADAFVPFETTRADDVRTIRAAYLHALGQRQPDRPLDGNHLSIRFMPASLDAKFAGVTLDGVNAPHVNESYDGPNGWVVQLVTNDNGEVVMFGGKLRYRLVTGNVQHWVDGEAVKPGDYTAPLLR